MEILFEVTGRLGRKIRTTVSHWKFITERKHPEMAGLDYFVQFALMDADCVRVSQDDSEVYLYYKRFKKYYVCVVCRHENGNGFIVTAYLTNRIKEGRETWRK